MRKENKKYVGLWYVYIAECRDKTFYVGIARDPDKRIAEHNKTKRCRYTRYRKPIVLKYKEICDNYGAARKRETEIKKFSRKKKGEIISR
ncbi:MAG: GIY-YIG nuclease family protein [Candidatus Omnitrophica bacterium]|nr:GIY-YIG nuclease family protein [Candidatus Omnitrophota bacterium]